MAISINLLRGPELHGRLEVLYINPFVTKWNGLSHIARGDLPL